MSTPEPSPDASTGPNPPRTPDPSHPALLDVELLRTARTRPAADALTGHVAASFSQPAPAPPTAER